MTAETTAENNWPGDKLERAAEARKLQNYLLSKYDLQKGAGAPRNLVTSLRAPWGAGKTYLLTNWQKELNNNNYVCVLFDAWKNDFTADPLIGVIATIETQLRELVCQNEKSLVTGQGVLGALKTVAKLGAVITGKWALGEAGLSMVADLAEKGMGEVEKEYSSVKEHKARLDYIEKFKEALKSLVEQIEKWGGEKNLPLFIFVDELDRCRPTYAIEVLENIKHLFDVNGVYFVIATDLSELAHSVKAVYGEGFDAAKYLKRFFDLDFLLAEPSKVAFIDNLFQQRGYDKFATKVTTPFDSFEGTTDAYPNMLNAFRAVCDLFNLRLRDIEQIAFAFEAVMLEGAIRHRKICMYYLMYLLCLRHIEPDVIQKARQMEYNNGSLEGLLFGSIGSRLNHSIKIEDYQTTNLGRFINSWDEITVIKIMNEAYRPHISKNINQISEAIRRPDPTSGKIYIENQVVNEIFTSGSNLSWQQQFNYPAPTPSPIGDYHKAVAALGQLTSPMNSIDQNSQ